MRLTYLPHNKPTRIHKQAMTHAIFSGHVIRISASAMSSCHMRGPNLIHNNLEDPPLITGGSHPLTYRLKFPALPLP